MTMVCVLKSLGPPGDGGCGHRLVDALVHPAAELIGQPRGGRPGDRAVAEYA
jgi:hypothetical protein